MLMTEELISIPTSQGDIKIYLPFQYEDKQGKMRHLNSISVRVSGGTDSALLSYILLLFKREHRPDLKIYASTSINPFKAYQGIFSTKVIKKIEELIGIKFDAHEMSECDGSTVEAYRSSQSILINYVKNKYNINVCFNGETMNPSEPEFMNAGRDPARDGFTTKYGTQGFGVNQLPFRNINKRAIAEMYEYLNILEELFPLTRSCEKTTTDFSHHCGICWFCQERQWGFGRLV